jgi:signal transduction histidine kinase/CheY-like chemotaxis protein/ligand-binding sensor domain-containing protein
MPAAWKPRRPLFLFVLLASFLGSSVFLNLIASTTDAKKTRTTIDPVSSGRIAFTHFTDRNGLPQNAIQAMAFDKKGYLWIGSQDGAAYYNGKIWTVVNMPNRTISNFVRAILVASDDSIWFGRQEGGVSRLKDGVWTTFDEKSGLPDKRINALLETKSADGSSTIWIGTDRGLAQLRNGELTRADSSGPFPTEHISSLIESRNGDGPAAVWVGTEKGLVRFSNGGRKIITVKDGLPRDHVICLLATRDSVGQAILWVGTRDGLIRYDVNEDRFSLLDSKSGIPPNTIVSLAETIEPDGSHVLWAGTDAGGLLRYQDGAWTIFSTREGLYSNSVFSLLPSSGANVTETLWIGTDGGGLARLTLGGWRSFSTNNGLPVNSIYCIFETQDSSGPAMWFGTYGGGLARLQDGSWTIFDRSSGMPDNTVFEMLETTLDDGQHVLWAGMKGGGLTRFEHGRWVKGEIENALGNSTVRSMLATTDEDGSRVVWVASGGHGLARFSKNKWTFFNSTNGLPHDSVFEMAETIDQDGTHVLWVATGGGGIARFAKGQWRVLDITSGLPSNSVLSLLIDRARDGKTYLWAGTEGGGLARLELNENALDAPHWLTFSDSTSPALPNNTIYQVRQDAHGAIYVSHNKGVSRLTPRYDETKGNAIAGYDVNTFTTEDGLPANEGNGGVSLVDSKGRIWFGGVGGAAVFDPAHEIPKQTPSQLYIEKTLVGDKATVFGPSHTLPYDQNHVSFEYALLSFAHEDGTRFSTQLVGLEHGPTGWTTDSKRDFSSLQPGTYTFKVWGRDSSGNITGPVSTSFTIKPPLTRTWGAYALYVAVLAGLAFAVVRLRTRSLRLRNEWLKGRVNERTRELAEKVEELRDSEQRAYNYAQAKSRFLANMSHEIRTPINGVIGMTSLLLDTPLSPEQRERADVVKRSGNILLTIVNDILDFSKIEAGKLTLESIDFELNSAIEDVFELVASKAQSKDLELGSFIDNDVPQSIKGDPIRLRQILINLVDNAIKFTERGGISVRVRQVSNLDENIVLKFEVRDTGIGVKPEDVGDLFTAFTQADSSTTRRYGGTGLGLTIAKQLVELMDGEIGVESQGMDHADTGSTFWFTARFVSSSAVAAELPVFESKSALYVGRAGIQQQRIMTLLTDWKIDATSSSNRNDAIAKLRSSNRYDVVLIDYALPEDDVRALTKIVFNETSSPIILMKSFGAHPDFEEQCYVLSKPVRRAQLFAELSFAFNPSLKRSERSTAVKVVSRQVKKQPHRLLLVEDNTTNQEIVVMNLSQLGFEIETVKNGREAVEALQRAQYDLVFMDCHMPEMDGFEATTLIRGQEKRGQRMPIIAMTASVLPQDRARCLAVGMDDYLAKPLNRDDLQIVLERWLNVRPAIAKEDSPVAHDALEKLRQLGGSNDSFLSELIDVFQIESLERLKQMKEAAATSDLAKLQNLAHTHRGACINFGAQRMAELCEQVECTTTAEPRLMNETIAEIESEFFKVSRVLQVERVHVS